MAAHKAVSAIQDKLDSNLSVPVRAWNKGNLDKPYVVVWMPNNPTDGSKTGRYDVPRIQIDVYHDSSWHQCGEIISDIRGLLDSKPLNIGSSHHVSYVHHDQDYSQPRTMDGKQEIHLISDYRLMIVDTS